MIEGIDNIAELFTIFHDGSITLIEHNENLLLEVDIQYLAERIDPRYSKFFLTLHDVEAVAFLTWPRDKTAEPERLTSVPKIFSADLEILEGAVENGKLKVNCWQHAGASPCTYCTLSFQTTAATVKDESGRACTLDELDKISRDYWTEFQARAKQP